MEDSDYERLVSMKVKLQLNIVSLVGAYGKPAQEKAQMLLGKGNYSFFGSDLHRLRAFMAGVNVKGLKKEQVTMLSGIQNMIV